MTELPVPVIVPAVVFPFATPSTVQVTPVFVLPDTEAVKEAVAPVVRVVDVGLRDTATGGGGVWIVMVADALFVASAWLVAVRVWLPAAAGAV